MNLLLTLACIALGLFCLLLVAGLALVTWAAWIFSAGTPWEEG